MKPKSKSSHPSVMQAGIAVNQVYEQSVGEKKFWDFFDSIYKEQDHQRSLLVGKLLTIVDAITESDGRQKAIKDLIHEAVNSVEDRKYQLNGEINDRLRQHYNPELLQGSASSTPKSVYLPPLPTIEEYLNK